MDVFLLISCITVALLLFIAAIYATVFFQDENERRQEWIPKILVIITITVASYSALLIPLGVVESQAVVGWASIATFYSAALLSFLCAPFGCLLWEDLEEPTRKRLFNALKWTIPSLICLATAFFLLQRYAAYCVVPGAPQAPKNSILSLDCFPGRNCTVSKNDFTVEIQWLPFGLVLVSAILLVPVAVFSGVGSMVLWIRPLLAATAPKGSAKEKKSSLLQKCNRLIEGHFSTAAEKNSPIPSTIRREIRKVESEFSELQSNPQGKGKLFSALTALFFFLLFSLWCVQLGMGVFRPSLDPIGWCLFQMEKIPLLSTLCFVAIASWLMVSSALGTWETGIVLPVAKGRSEITDLLGNSSLIAFGLPSITLWLSSLLPTYVETSTFGATLLQITRYCPSMRWVAWIAAGSFTVASLATLLVCILNKSFITPC